LSAKEWDRPTVCPGWTVKDIASHLLGVDVGNLARRRDEFPGPSSGTPSAENWSELVALVAKLNESWVAATRRLSPRLLCELLRFTGEAIADYFANLDPGAMGGSIAWVGSEPAPVWLDIAREYTERWVHQQQIRDAVDRPGLLEPRYLTPVLATFVHALPHSLRDVAPEPGTCLRLDITGPAGGVWIAMRTETSWALLQDRPGQVDAAVTLSQDVAWRLWTRMLSRLDALPYARFAGDRSLGERVLDMLSIIA
jgi:uncharacterized protein (TIGR03083 family)